jgi:hypothetical protein
MRICPGKPRCLLLCFSLCWACFFQEKYISLCVCWLRMGTYVHIYIHTHFLLIHNTVYLAYITRVRDAVVRVRDRVARAYDRGGGDRGLGRELARQRESVGRLFSVGLDGSLFCPDSNFVPHSRLTADSRALCVWGVLPSGEPRDTRIAFDPPWAKK